jgi:DNA replicative helicase MCM subunit Mcm2 (Cdc46/Mcm family)
MSDVLRVVHQSDFDNIEEIQARLNRSVQEETNTEEKIDFIELLRDLERYDGRRVHYDEILVEARLLGMTEATVKRLLHELEEDKIIAAVDDGCYRLLD